MGKSRISSPASTGGAGTIFEQHVDAFWLSLLLVQAIPPILRDCNVAEVHFQTENLGWNTNDFLILGETGSQAKRKLVGQVKRTFSVSATDDECKKTIQEFWKDFRNRQQFSPAEDRFVLVTLRGTNTLLEHFSGLLDSARAAANDAEFTRRLAVPGFISAKAVQYRDEIQTIVSEIEGRTLTDADLWPFFCVLHVVSLDLNTATGQTEAVIKTLLAYMTKEQDAVGAADASWNSLLKLAGEGMPQARSFKRSDLPSDLLDRHSPVGGREQRALQTLKDHSTIILDGIRSTIGDDLHLARAGLVNQIVQQLESTQIVLVSGAAGNGKSGVAKDVVSILSKDQFAFSFRAEEFARAHFDEVLERAQIGANATAIGAILAGQGRKLLLVESVERLLEKSTRDAFTDLLTLAAKDRAWRIILTCRDYSLDLVRDCFLESVRVSHSVVMVPPLDDTELGEIESASPDLKRPLASPVLRGLLRNLYILDKARQISWSNDRPLPQSEREFRDLFWQDIVRVDHRTAGGMPRRREEVFGKIALRRAQALTLFAACGELDPEVLDAFRNDSIIVCSSQNKILVAPAHDVLEDWAIIRWIDEQYVAHHQSADQLSAALGTYPAIRRTYRKWVAELVARDVGDADRLFQAVVNGAGLPPQFRDDTFVALLRSPSAPAFLERHRAELFANEKGLFRRVIHLLRVACVTTPLWLTQAVAHASIFNIPDGPAWASLLRLVQSNLQLFIAADAPLLLGLIEDWGRGVSWQLPYPEGAESVAAITHWLLPHFDNYRSAEQRKRTLQVIAKVPNSDPKGFAMLLEGSRDDDERDRASDDFRKIILEGIEGMPAARDMPDATIAAARDYLFCSEADLERGRGFGGSMELEPLFGIKENRSHGYFPASALRGPFLPLLRHHFSKALDFIISIFNHSAEWYAHPRVHSRIEPPLQITLRFSDGTSRNQWCNDRLWNLYRGMSGGPYALQSILMALERWLLEVADAQPRELEAILQNILRRSDSAALTAVVASVATAFPHASGEALLTLLRTPACFFLDRHRMSQESGAASLLQNLMPQLDASKQVFDQERNESSSLKHRPQDLEAAIANLQLGPLAARVREILDWHRSQLPSIEKQEEGDRLWRLAMHRMDLRQYMVAPEEAKREPDSDDQTPPTDGKSYVKLELREPEPDIKQMVDESNVEMRELNAKMGLQMWGLKVYQFEEETRYDPKQWQLRLQEARTLTPNAGTDDRRDMARDGPGFVAAVCVRDHWNEMSEDDRTWCVNTVCSEIRQQDGNWNQMDRLQRNSMSADRPAAWVVSILVAKTLRDEQQIQVRKAFVIALTHPIDEVRSYAAWGIARNLWSVDRDLALLCVNALAAQATFVQQAIDAQAGHSFLDSGQIDLIESEAAAEIRKSFDTGTSIPEDSFEKMEYAGWFTSEATVAILTILGQAASEPLAVSGFERIAVLLVAWWDNDDNRNRDHGNPIPQRNHDTESALTSLMEGFVLRTEASAAASIIQPLLNAVDRHTREIYWFIQGLTAAEDRQPNTPQFWGLWNLFADKIKHATWISRIDEEHATGTEVLRAIFLTLNWKKHVRHWSSLEGYAENVNSLFDALPVSATVLDDYVRFLYHIGTRLLPNVFVQIAKQCAKANSDLILNSNTVFMLEVLLRRYVYTKPLELKQNAHLRDAILQILELLISQGSSAAFRMRDDFVTPTGGEEAAC